jgi:hypothetical protein
MNIKYSLSPSVEAKVILASLTKAVTHALEKNKN